MSKSVFRRLALQMNQEEMAEFLASNLPVKTLLLALNKRRAGYGMKRLTQRAVDLGWTCAKCGCSNIESDLLCGFCDTPRPSH